MKRITEKAAPEAPRTDAAGLIVAGPDADEREVGTALGRFRNT